MTDLAVIHESFQIDCGGKILVLPTKRDLPFTREKNYVLVTDTHKLLVHSAIWQVNVEPSSHPTQQLRKNNLHFLKIPGQLYILELRVILDKRKHKVMPALDHQQYIDKTCFVAMRWRMYEELYFMWW
jgi:hypothetical protein